jgi:iron complex outermembrane receptor protein
MEYRSTKLPLLAAAVAAVLSPPGAAVAAEVQLEEIVVTARQREERIEDVPATVQAFTALEIQNAGIERPTDFIQLTPGVAQVQTAEAGDLQVVIRGINTGRDAETNVALVIDGVLQTNPNALNQELNNVAQIEVLKGPQGALYGRNAVAGAFIITTRKPGDSFEMDVGAGYGTENSYKGNIYVGGPIGDSVRASLSAYTRSTDGQWDNSLLGCDDCVDFFEETGVSGRMLFDIGERSSIDVKAKYSKIKAGAINFNASLALRETALFLGSIGVPTAELFWEDANTHDFLYINNVKPENEQENFNFSIKGDFDLDFATLTAVAAFNDQTNFFLTDGTSAAFFLYSLTPACLASNDAQPGAPLPAPFGPYLPSNGFVQTFYPPYSPALCDGYQYQVRDQQDTSLEVRLTSPGDEAFRWVAGLYAADIERDQAVSQGSDNGAGFVKESFVPASGPNPSDLVYDDTFNSKVYAAFGQLAYDVTDNVEVAVALRYDREERKVTNNVPTCDNSGDLTGPCRAQTPLFGLAFNQTTPYINPAYTVDPSLAVNGIPDRERTFTQFQPKLTINWKVTDEWALYTSYGYGFRSGGFNSTGSSATTEVYYGGLCLGDTQSEADGYFPVCTGNNRSLQNVNDDYEKEVSKAFEVGFKSTLFEGTLSLNGAYYQTDVENMQFFNFFAGPFGLLRVVTNLEEASISGFEVDARWRATEYLTLFAGYGYTDTEIDRYDGRPYTVGNRIPYVPEYTGNAGVDLAVPLGGSDWTLNARIETSFMGETYFTTVQDEQVPNLFTGFGFGQGEFSKQKRDPYSVVNARVGVSNGTWTVTGWGRNIGDEKYLQEIIPAPEFGGSFIHDSPGASYGIDVSYSFR